MKKILSFDVGGTKIAYSILDDSGNILTEIKKVSTPKNKEEIQTLFSNIVKRYEDEIDLISFATAGSVNIDNNGISSATHNMPEGYQNIEFSKLSKKSVYVENDANAAAWAEYKVGAGVGESNCIIITLGTGIGGGFIVNGSLLRGKNGLAGEVGSMKISSEGRICTCGRKDCFEAYASGTGLKKTAEEFAYKRETFKNSIYNSKNPQDITTYDIINGINSNDEYSLAVFQQWKKHLIIGLVNIVNIFNPDSIIISGGMGEFIQTKEIELEVNSETVVSPVRIKLAQTGNNAGLIGAALLAANKYN